MKSTQDRLNFGITLSNTLNSAGFDANVVGGILRAAALGGVTGDTDIAIIAGIEALEHIDQFLTIQLGFELMHKQDLERYWNIAEFLADYRLGDVNIIIYNAAKVPDLERLLDTFDLNINMYHLNEDNELVNNHFDGVHVEVGSLANYSDARYNRFKSEYGHLNWDKADAQLEAVHKAEVLF